MTSWYTHNCCGVKSSKPNAASVVLPLMTQARKMLQTNQLVADGTGGDKDPTSTKLNIGGSKATSNWLARVLRGGTIPDRINAMAFIAQEKPLECLVYLEKLIALVNPAKKRDCLRAMEALHGIWKNNLLPSHRALIPFDCRPLEALDKIEKKNLLQIKHKKNNGTLKDPGSAKDRLLLYWIFEEELRIKYHSFIKNMENVILMDTIEATKRKVGNILFDLLEHKPEARQKLLQILVNKIGDPNRKLATNIVYKLNQLIQHKINLLSEVLDQVETLLFRPNVSDRAQYYIIAFLNQIQFRKGCSSHQAIAVRLVKIYASFFRAAVKDKEMNEKMLTALLTGVNRTVPFVEGSLDEIDEHLSTMFRLVHTTLFAVSVQTLMVLLHVAKHKEELRDRFYQALYRKLLDPAVRSTSKLSLLTHLLFNSLKADTDEQRIKAFIKRLLQVCCNHQDPGFICAILIMISKLCTLSPTLVNTKNVTKAVLHESDSEEHFSDAESSGDEIDSKPSHEPLLLANTDMPSSKTHPASSVDAPLNTIPSWNHRHLKHRGPSGCQNGGHGVGYDPTARNPRFANALTECAWELDMLSSSGHPSVAIFAEKVIQGEPMDYPGNPFDDFTLSHFLERFVFKNPKIAEKKKSKIGPTSFTLKGAKSVPVNSSEFLTMDESKIPEDEKFFYRYFNFINAKGKKGGADDNASDAGSVADSEFDDYLNKYEKQLIQDDSDGSELDDDELSDFTMSDDDKEDDDDTVQDISNIADFDALDGEEVAAFRNKGKKKSKHLIDLDEDSEDDEDIDMEGEESGEEESDEEENSEEESDEGDDDIDDDEDESDYDMPVKGSNKRKASSGKLDKLFVSADKIGDMFESQETPKEKKQRLWEIQREGKGMSRRNKNFKSRR